MNFITLFESPDSIVAHGRSVSYDHCDGSYTFCVFTGGAACVVEDRPDFYGHQEVVSAIKRYLRASDESGLHGRGVKLTAPMSAYDPSDYPIKGRAWPKYNIVSLWSKATPDAITGTLAVLKAIGVKAEDMTFEVEGATALAGSENPNVMTYNDFIRGRKLSSDEIAKEREDREYYERLMSGVANGVKQAGHDETRFAPRQRGKAKEIVPVPVPSKTDPEPELTDWEEDDQRWQRHRTDREEADRWWRHRLTPARV